MLYSIAAAAFGLHVPAGLHNTRTFETPHLTLNGGDWRGDQSHLLASDRAHVGPTWTPIGSERSARIAMGPTSEDTECTEVDSAAAAAVSVADRSELTRAASSGSFLARTRSERSARIAMQSPMVCEVDTSAHDAPAVRAKGLVKEEAFVWKAGSQVSNRPDLTRSTGSDMSARDVRMSGRVARATTRGTTGASTGRLEGRVEGQSLLLGDLELRALPDGYNGKPSTPDGGFDVNSKQPFELPAGFEIVSRQHPDFKTIVDQAIKPYPWNSALVVVENGRTAMGIQTFSAYHGSKYGTAGVIAHEHITGAIKHLGGRRYQFTDSVTNFRLLLCKGSSDPIVEAKAKLQEAEAKAHDAYTEVARLEDALEEARLVAAQMAPAVEAAQAKVEQASRQVVEEAQAAIGKAYSAKEEAKAAVDAAKAEVDSVIGGIESVKAIPAAVAAMRPVLATAQALLVREIAALEEADVAVRKAESHAKSVAQGKRNHVW